LYNDVNVDVDRSGSLIIDINIDVIGLRIVVQGVVRAIVQVVVVVVWGVRP
jgi:hypothetical protein